MSQVLKYRDSLLQNLGNLDSAPIQQLLRSEPRCLVVIGKSSQLSTENERASFERIRERIQGVTIITFDELFRRVASLESLLSAPLQTGEEYQ